MNAMAYVASVVAIVVSSFIRSRFVDSRAPVRSATNMRSIQLSLIALTLGLSLAACSDDAPIAPDETGTETGTETGDGDGDMTGDGDGDMTGDGDGDMTGDGDGDMTGDGDGDAAECGNGEVEEGEECDDANDVDDDACTNACTLPVCGDGIVQVDLGETCDDGNTLSGDTCTSMCHDPGTPLWEVAVDIGDDSADIGYEVELDSEGNINVLMTTDGDFRLAEFDDEGSLVWDFAALDTEEPNLAICPDDSLLIGGNFNGAQAATRLYDGGGNQVWTETAMAVDSSALAVLCGEGGEILSGGYYQGDQAMLLALDGQGESIWSKLQDDGGAYLHLATNASGQLWGIQEDPLVVQTWLGDGSPGWTSPPLETAMYRDIAADDEGNVYVLAQSMDSSLLTVAKYDNSGAFQWGVDEDMPGAVEIAGSLTTLPAGGVLVSGGSLTQAEGDGILLMLDPEGEPWVDSIIVDGPADMDADLFFDVALGDGYAVAVGAHDASDANSDVWLYAFEI